MRMLLSVPTLFLPEMHREGIESSKVNQPISTHYRNSALTHLYYSVQFRSEMYPFRSKFKGGIERRVGMALGSVFALRMLSPGSTLTLKRVDVHFLDDAQTVSAVSACASRR